MVPLCPSSASSAILTYCHIGGCPQGFRIQLVVGRGEGTKRCMGMTTTHVCQVDGESRD